MGNAADFLVKALECETLAAEIEVPLARAVFLAIAGRWREMAEDAADREAARRFSSGPSLSA